MGRAIRPDASSSNITVIQTSSLATNYKSEINIANTLRVIWACSAWCHGLLLIGTRYIIKRMVEHEWFPSEIGLKDSVRENGSGRKAQPLWHDYRITRSVSYPETVQAAMMG